MTAVRTFPSDGAIAFSPPGGLITSAANTGEGLYPISTQRDHTTNWLQDCIDRIGRLHQLKPNWDSYGAEPVDPRSIEFAKQFLQDLVFLSTVECPRVAASPEGNVALSWESADYLCELDLEVLPDGHIQYSYIDERPPVFEIEGETAAPDPIVNLLAQW